MCVARGKFDLWHAASRVCSGDAGQGSLTPPGCITATPCEAPLDLQDGSAVEVTSPPDPNDYQFCSGLWSVYVFEDMVVLTIFLSLR